MTIEELNNVSAEAAFDALFTCCGSTRWAKNLAVNRPFLDFQDVLSKASELWADCSEEDGLEAFTHHPKIGDIKSLEEKFASTSKWAGGEQSGVNDADRSVLEALAAGNEAYEQKFGYIFIVCATGKSASEMLALLEQRLPNDPDSELKIAMQEQHKITEIRLEKLLK